MDQPAPDIKAVLHDPESGNRIRAIEGCEQSVAGRFSASITSYWIASSLQVRKDKY